MSADRMLSSPARRVARAAVPVAIVALAVAACGSSSGAKTTPAAAADPGSGAAGPGVTLTTKTGPLGTYLTDGSGKSLYEFNSDSATKSTCSGTCLTYWPALTSSSPAAAGSGVTAADIGSLTRSDGSTQVTYKGHPLYYFALDKAAGDTKGQGLDDFGAKWWLLNPAGSIITASASSSSSPSPSNGGGVYGY